jgi:hypothetical protein
LGGKPVVLNFGPQYFYAESDWTSILSVFSGGAQFFPLNYRLGTVAAGAFPWPPMWLSSGGVLAPEVLDQYLDNFYAGATTWPGVVGCAVPGFHDIYQEAGVQPSYGYLDARGGLTFAETMDRAVLAQSPVIQLVTWNDFKEGTNIEPAQEYGYQYLEHVQDVARGFRALPYSPEDLVLPYTLYGLRKLHPADAVLKAQLDQAAALIIAGEPAQARAIFGTLLAVEPGSLPSPSLAIRISPSPVVTTAAVLLDLPTSGEMRLDLFDASGRRIACLASGHQETGRHRLVWDAGRHPTGIYFMSLRAGGKVATRKVLVEH